MQGKIEEDSERESQPSDSFFVEASGGKWNMGQMQYDVTALGELLIDFTQDKHSGSQEKRFVQHAGGAPANVAAAVSRLGGTAAFIGCVGEDLFGIELQEVLKRFGMDTGGLQITKESGTTLAFVQIDEDGERSFQFYRHPGADTRLQWKDSIAERIKESKVFHFGSLSLTDEPARSTTIQAVRLAAERRRVVSFDPNLRPILWKDLDEARTVITQMLTMADVVKVSEEELIFLSDGSGSLETKAKELQERYDIPLLLVTRGKDGCHYRFGSRSGDVPSIPVRAVDTTGAGDAFVGGFLYELTRRKSEDVMSDLGEEQLRRMLRFACAVAAWNTTRSGAMEGMPKLHEVQRFVQDEGSIG